MLASVNPCNKDTTELLLEIIMHVNRIHIQCNNTANTSEIITGNSKNSWLMCKNTFWYLKSKSSKTSVAEMSGQFGPVTAVQSKNIYPHYDL